MTKVSSFVESSASSPAMTEEVSSSFVSSDFCVDLDVVLEASLTFGGMVVDTPLFSFTRFIVDDQSFLILSIELCGPSWVVLVPVFVASMAGIVCSVGKESIFESVLREESVVSMFCLAVCGWALFVFLWAVCAMFIAAKLSLPTIGAAVKRPCIDFHAHELCMELYAHELLFVDLTLKDWSCYNFLLLRSLFNIVLMFPLWRGSCSFHPLGHWYYSFWRRSRSDAQSDRFVRMATASTCCFKPIISNLGFHMGTYFF